MLRTLILVVLIAAALTAYGTRLTEDDIREIVRSEIANIGVTGEPVPGRFLLWSRFSPAQYPP